MKFNTRFERNIEDEIGSETVEVLKEIIRSKTLNESQAIDAGLNKATAYDLLVDGFLLARVAFVEDIESNDVACCLWETGMNSAYFSARPASEEIKDSELEALVALFEDNGIHPKSYIMPILNLVTTTWEGSWEDGLRCSNPYDSIISENILSYGLDS